MKYKMFALLFLLPFAVAQAQAPACSAPSKVCSATQTTPTPSGTTCGKKGTVETPALLIPRCQYSSLESCRTTCLGNASCRSFSWDSNQGVCEIYSKDIAVMKFKAATNTKQFFAKGCFSFTCSNPSTTTIVETVTPSPTPCPNTGSEPNLGFSMGFAGGTSPGTDQTVTGGTIGYTVQDSAYCGGTGQWCKRVDLLNGNSPSLHNYTTPRAPISSNAQLSYRVSMTARKLYQSSTCYTVISGFFYDSQGLVFSSTAQSTSTNVPWGTTAPNTFTFSNSKSGESYVSAGISVYCLTSSDGRSNSVFIDDVSLTAL